MAEGQVQSTLLQAQYPYSRHARDTDTLCGIGRCKPKCAQSCANMVLFLLSLGFSLLLTTFLGIYLITQLTTIEKQLGISSTQAGLLLSMNEIGFMATVLFWSHFARRVHKPRWLSGSTFLFGVGAILGAVPHFVFISNEPDMYNFATGNNSKQHGSAGLCRTNETLFSDSSPSIATASDILRKKAFVILAIAMAIGGVAKAPRMPLGSTYIDDNVGKSKTGIYFGALIAMAILGPVFGSQLGGAFNRIFVTLEDTPLSADDPRFVGAWWLGFIIIAVMSFLAAIPLVVFPRKMPNSTYEETPFPRSEKFRDLLKDFHRSALRLLKNPIFIIIVVCDGIGMFTISGRVSFFPKYLEHHFRTAVGRSNILMGASVMTGAVSGSLLSGIGSSVFKLTLRGCLFFLCIAETTGAVILLSGMAVSCDQTVLHGLAKASEPLSTLSAKGNWTCDTSCYCSEQDYLPSCGSDGRTYFSPCHAGCSSQITYGSFANCSCITDSPEQTVTPGVCETECWTLTIYLVMAFITAFIASMAAVPSTLTKLRSVDDSDRSLGIGISAFVSSLLGFFLGPIVFGALIDSCCVLWIGAGNGRSEDRGYCALYDTSDIRVKMHVFTGGVRCTMLILYVIALIIAHRVDRYKKIIAQQKQDYSEEKVKRRQQNVKNDIDSDSAAYGLTEPSIDVNKTIA